MTIQKGGSDVEFDLVYMRSCVFFKEKTASTLKGASTTPQAAKYQDKHQTIVQRQLITSNDNDGDWRQARGAALLL